MNIFFDTAGFKVEPSKPKFKMVEIYRGKDEAWKGYHNLIIDLGCPGLDIPLAGPIDPKTSRLIFEAINNKVEIE